MTAVFAYLAMVFALALIVIAAVGQPPHHCRYLVPVKSAPGIYACSEYPRPMVKP